MPLVTRIRITLACACVWACATLGGALAHAPEAAAAPWNHVQNLGAAAEQSQLLRPRGLTLDSSGNVYVADTEHNRVQRFDSSGTYIGELGTLGTGPGQLRSPSDVAVDSSGDILVVDSGNHRVQRFDASGAFVAQFGNWGTGNGEFNDPWGIAIAPGGELYVTDQWNQRVQYFSAAGAYLGQFGSFGNGAGQFDDPRGIAVAPDGRVYVADNFNNRVQVFSATGTYLDQATTGQGGQPFAAVSDVALDSAGNVYLADSWHGTVQILDPSLDYLDRFGVFGYYVSPIGMVEARSVAVDASGNVYALDSAYDRVLKLDSTGAMVGRFGTAGPRELAHAEALDRSPVDGALYVVDSTNDRVQKWAANGAYVGAFGTTGSGNGQFQGPTDVAVAANGDVYVTDARNCRVQRFSDAGVFRSAFGSCGSSNGRFATPTGITVAADGSLLVVDSGNSRVQRFTAGGAFIATFGSNGSGPGQFLDPMAASIAPDGSIYVSDQSNHRIQRFTAGGAFIATFGTQGSGAGQLDRPQGLTISDDGTVFVVDWGNRRVNRYTATGTFIESAPGSDRPTDIIAAAPNQIWVADSGANRIELHTAEPYAPAALRQLQRDGVTSVAAGATTDQTAAVLGFDVAARVGSQRLTPWVEVRPIAVPLSATCGAAIAGVTFSGEATDLPERAVAASVQVPVTGLVSGTQYHWRACAVDQDGAPGPWTSMGGSDGTTDFGVDTSGPFAVRGTALRGETDLTPWQACNGIVPNVHISVAGAPPVSTSCDRTTGAFSFSGLTKPPSTSLLTVWINDAASRGVTYYSVSGDASAITLLLTQDRVRLTTELTSDTITRSELQIQDSLDAPAIPVDATSGGRLTAAPGIELHVDAGVRFESQGQLDIGSFHVAPAATLDTGSASVRVRGTGTLDDCDAGPRRSTPMCVERTGTIAPIPAWVDWHYDPTDSARRVGVSTDVDYSSLRLAGGVDYTFGTRNGQTLTVGSQLDIGGGARAESTSFAPDVVMYNLWAGYGARWSGTRAFTIEAADGLAGDGELDLPRADATLLGRSPSSYLASNFSDWDLGSVTITGSNGRHEFGSGGIDVHDGGAADDPVAVVAENGDQHVFVVYNRDNGATGTDWVIRKYNTFGAGLDTGFGVAGELAVAVPGTDTATSAQIGPNGNLLVAGAAGGDWAVKSFAVGSGAPDTSFDGDGVWAPGTPGTVTALLHHQGNLFVAGSDGSDTWQIHRLNGAGALQETRTWDGDTGSGSQPASIAAMCAGPPWEAGDVTVVGDVGAPGSRDWAVGSLRPSGGSWGWVSFVGASARPERISSVGTDDHATTCYSSTSRVLVGGTTGDGGTSNVGTIRSYDRRDGAPSIGFGTGGVVVLDGPGEDALTSIRGFDLRNAVTVLSGDGGGSGGRAVVRSLDMDGRVDSTFNNGAGAIVYDDTAGAERPVALTFAWQMLHVLARSSSNGGDTAVQQFDSAGDRQESWTAGTARTLLLGAGHRLHVHGDLTIGADDPNYGTILDAKAFDGDLEVDGDIEVKNDALLRAPRVEPLIAHGDIDIAGTFSDESGTVRVDPRSRRVHVRTASSTSFHGLRITAPSGGADVLLDGSDDIRVTGQFDAVGHSCAAPLRLRPDGADWTLDSTGALDGDVNHVDLENVTFTPARVASNSWDRGGVSGAVFSSPCASAGDPGSPEGLLVNGITRPRDVAPDPHPVLEWRNRTGSDVDTVDARVLSSSPQNVEALYHFDAGSELTDASGNGNTVFSDASAAAPGRFGAGRRTALGESVIIPDLPIAQEFTVGAWFKRGPLTGSDATFPVLVDRCIFTCSIKNFDMHIDGNSNRIFGEVTTGNGARTHTVLTDAAPYLDNQWHYATLTHGTNQLRLYLDGELVSRMPTGPGPIDVGAWNTNVGWNFNGDVDEVLLRSERASGAEIRGYYRTNRPHLDEVWRDGSLTVPTTPDGSTAAAEFGGTVDDLALEGARWWADARLRTTGATWSARSTADWFETTLADRTTLSLPDGPLIGLGSLTPGQDQHEEFTVRVTSSGALGWTLRASGEDDAYALSNGLDGTINQIARRTTPLWPAGEDGFAGITVLSAPGGKAAPWCGGSDPSDFAGQCYAWPDASGGMALHSTTTPNLSPLDTELSLRINLDGSTSVGQYSGELSVVAVPNV